MAIIAVGEERRQNALKVLLKAYFIGIINTDGVSGFETQRGKIYEKLINRWKRFKSRAY
jgi:hypothetical protein